MIIEAKNRGLYIDGVRQPSGAHGMLINVETSLPIRFARFADTDTGDWQAFACTQRGTMENPPRLIRGRNKIRFEISHAPVVRAKPLSPAEEAQEIRAIARDYVKNYMPIMPMPGIECDEPGCHRLAEWQVGHEQEIDAGKMPDGSPCERAVTVKAERWCPKHWHPPTFTSTRGVQNEVEVQCRPQ